VRRPGVRWALLFLAGLAISAFSIRRNVDPFDEGLMLQAARRVFQGELPYRDFLWPYGPAQPFLLAGLFKAFGVSLMSWRIVRALTNASVALVVYGLTRRVAPPRLALVGWLAAACAMAEPTGPTPFPQALLFGLLALVVATAPEAGPRRLILAGALTALAAAWRLDFALYAGAGVLAALLVGRAGAERVRSAAIYAAGAVAAGLLVYAPFLVAAGPGTVWDGVVAQGFRDRDYWTLPFPLDYGGRFDLWPPGHLAADARHLLKFYVPALVLGGLALCAAILVARLASRRPVAPEAAGLLVLGGGAALYLLSRPDVAHEMALLVVLAALIPAVAAPWPGRPRAVGALAAAALAIGALLALDVVANRVSTLARRPALEAVHAPAADGVRAAPDEARGLSEVVALVRARVPPGGAIYVAPRRSDLIRTNNPLVYVLAERDNASGEDFGLLTSAAAQRRIVARLERARPAAIVRWTDPESSRPEPNLRGRSSGSRALDEWIAARYRFERRAGHYDLLVPL
jgi:hypothetical protein